MPATSTVAPASAAYVTGSLTYTHKTILTDVFNTIDEAVAGGARFTPADAARIERELNEIDYWAKRLIALVETNTLEG